MHCPICGSVAVVEGPLLKHLLRRHPEAQAVAALGLSLGTVLLSGTPRQLLWFYLALVAVATVISMSGRPSAGYA
jgi:hypothetical protein